MRRQHAGKVGKMFIPEILETAQLNMEVYDYQVTMVST